MTLPPVVRVFFALSIPETIKAALAEVISQLKKQSKSHAIRWSRQENLHVTLQFLPEVRREDVPILIKNVQSQLSGQVAAIPVFLGEVHVFPNPYRPRVIVLEVGPQQELAELADRIGLGMKMTNYLPEERSFRAHLTLGRIKQPQGLNLAFLSECPLPALSRMEVSDLVLFRSQPQPEGSKYTEIEKIRFAEMVNKQ